MLARYTERCIGVRPLSVRQIGVYRIKKAPPVGETFHLCWHYLSSRQVTLQVLSAQMSLTSVFGMGTGGPSSQSIPTISDGLIPIVFSMSKLSQALTANELKHW